MKACKYCKKEFETPPPGIRDFCSVECRMAKKRDDNRKSWKGRSRSDYKRSRQSDGPIKRSCEICGKVFRLTGPGPGSGNRKTCSLACSHELSVRRRRRNYKEITKSSRVKVCRLCGVEFKLIRGQHANVKYCSEVCKRQANTQARRKAREAGDK